jgi:predicted nucleic acid-binding protein
MRIDRVVVMAWDAGPGETAVISLARTASDLRAVVDDDYARRCARVLGVKTLGTCGVILLAKRRGIIPCVKPALDALRSAGLWLSDSLIQTILIEAGEI